jgi:hypothetical protein
MHPNTAQAVLDELTWHERLLTENAALLTVAELSKRRRRIAVLRAKLTGRRQLPRGDGACSAAQWLACFFIYCLVLGIRDWGIRTLLWTQLLRLADLSWRAIRVAYLPPSFHEGPVPAGNPQREGTSDEE